MLTRTSVSSQSAPSRTAAANEAIVFSGAVAGEPRCPTTVIRGQAGAARAGPEPTRGHTAAVNSAARASGDARNSPRIRPMDQ
ncbi:hypothetical protein GCM10023235_08390 [Kitasatospora terrestris]|uniref:Uncharacterized protein n=1 Tax=Kitasatospora terrestris TaxID=258051 RepID=A0ABP9D9E7_9ACTN